jgi:hypothetical protein
VPLFTDITQSATFDHERKASIRIQCPCSGGFLISDQGLPSALALAETVADEKLVETTDFPFDLQIKTGMIINWQVSQRSCPQSVRNPVSAGGQEMSSSQV